MASTLTSRCFLPRDGVVRFLLTTGLVSALLRSRTPGGVLAQAAHAPTSSSGEPDCLPPSSSNHSGSCICTAIRDIRCRGLDSVPKFSPFPDHEMYSGLYMAAQMISRLPEDIFLNIKVQKIMLNFNPIGEHLSSRSLSGLSKVLRELHLGDCGLKRLPEGLLTDMAQLEYLHLWANQIVSIPSGFFKSCENLRELSLWGNSIERLDDSTFSGLFKLRKLDLDRNRISVLTKEAFRHQRELEILHLGENRIQTIPSEVFSNAQSLRVLSLDGNNITSDGLKISKLANSDSGAVEIGRKGSRKVASVASSFHGLGNLQSLALNDNRLTNIPGNTFAPLHNLTMLSLQNNQLQNIWENAFGGLSSLQKLDLSKNKIARIYPGTLKETPKLRHLYLDHNQISLLHCFLPIGGSGGGKGGAANKMRLQTLSLLGNELQCGCSLTWLVNLYERHGVAVWGTCAPSTYLFDPKGVITRSAYFGLSCTFDGTSECRQ